MAIEHRKRSNPADTEGQELEQYGVWVKAGPERIDDGEEPTDTELADLSDIDVELTPEEERLLGDLEEGSDSSSLEEFSLGGVNDVEETEAPSEEKLDLDFGDEPALGDEVAMAEELDLGIQLDSEETTERIRDSDEAQLAPDDEELNLDLDLDLGGESLEPSLAGEEVETAGADLEDISLPTAEEDLSIDLSEPEIAASEQLPELEPELEIDEDFLKSADLEPDRIPESPSTNVDLVDEMEISFDSPAPPVPSPRAIDAGSLDILQKIEAELAAIKQEISELKKELSGLRALPAGLEAQTPDLTAPAEPEDDKAGFFDEDEDETIALTGDELDNILNTADITEERGQSDVVEGEEEELFGKDDILPTDEPEIPMEPLPATTEEDQAIIQEYERELDGFDSTTLDLADEDGIDEADLEALPEGPLEETDVEEIKEAEPALELEDSLNEPVELDLDAELEEPLEEMEISIPSEDIPAITIGSEEPLLEEGFAQPAPTASVEDELELLSEEPTEEPTPSPSRSSPVPDTLREEIATVLKYMDQLLEALPEDKIQEFAKSEHFEVYKRLFEELGLE